MKNKQKMSSPFKSLLSGRLAVIAIPYVWLLLFFLLPFIFVLKISLAEPIMAIPPYTSLLDWGDSWFPSVQASLESYLFLFSDSLYIKAYLSSLKLPSFQQSLLSSLDIQLHTAWQERQRVGGGYC